MKLSTFPGFSLDVMSPSSSGAEPAKAADSARIQSDDPPTS